MLVHFLLVSDFFIDKSAICLEAGLIDELSSTKTRKKKGQKKRRLEKNRKLNNGKKKSGKMFKCLCIMKLKIIT